MLQDIRRVLNDFSATRARRGRFIIVRADASGPTYHAGFGEFTEDRERAIRYDAMPSDTARAHGATAILA